MTKLPRRCAVAMAFAWVILTVVPPAVWADEQQLTLRLRRDFGYGGLAGDIEGDFTLVASGPSGMTRMSFLMDGNPVAEVTQAPFQYRFQTGQFPPGLHTMQAVGYTESGLELRSNVVAARFLTSAQARKGTIGLIVPLLAVIFGLMALSYAVTYVLAHRRGRSPQPGQGYGIMGGAICPRCKRPFARALLGLRVVGTQLERCPHCGKWAFLRSALPEAPASAEAAQQPAGGSSPLPLIPSEEDRLLRELEDSRYQEI
jgi:hypothetical protein